MKIFDWLFRAPNFVRFDDSFVMRRESLWAKLRDAIVHQQNLGDSVWVVAHFPDVYLTAQNFLADWQMEYQIVAQPLTSQSAASRANAQPQPIQLALAELLLPTESHTSELNPCSISMIVIERHPIIERDRQLQEFARSIPGKVRLGYYLAIDDAVVARIVSDTMLEILKQHGLKDHELIISNMITRRLDKVLTREGKSQKNSNVAADSATEWYEGTS